ncbi:ribosomal protein L4/L1e [Reticulomyxa filosa]|uniref:Large ribosomal subunit protein uL4m n=1 Tax=Reticulomyxa filosa TaxID=46433 RepID=X6MBR8_RETFI|nr:ribosomal protein L4/L1e [Reticulomyxa filosa]|eukprot:ETO10867.1 ribosomal protein L4/L1e [Reticulomyxa filosa]
MCDGRAPQFTKGGKAHAKRPKDWSTQLPRKIYQLGLKIALTARYREGDFFIWEDLRLPRLRVPRDVFRALFLILKKKKKKRGGIHCLQFAPYTNWSDVDKHVELQNLVPVEMLDWNESTKLYQDVARTRQMLKNWGWLKPYIQEKVNDKQTHSIIAEAKRSGNIVDMLEAMPISQFGWEFLKEEDELEDVVIPSVLIIHHGYVDPEFDENLKRVKGVDLVSTDELLDVKPVMGMAVTKLLKYKKIVITVEALRQIEDIVTIEREVEKWNYFADLNKLEQDENLPDAFPEDIYGPQGHENEGTILANEEKKLKMKSM